MKAGRVSLYAGTGIVLLDSIAGSSNGDAIVLNADYEFPGDGTLTVTVGKVSIEHVYACVCWVERITIPHGECSGD